MTDTSSLIITHSTPQLLPVTARSLASPTLNGSLSPSVPLEDDEPYTIKCICAFSDDDGNTVFCERCETWQHIECYYHGKKVPEVHNCADCEPRIVDGKRATERQKKLREQNDGGDRKPKRPAHKNHKKKVKDTTPATDQTNGWHDRQESSVGRDHPPPPKRPNTNHRTSHSITSTNGVSASHAESRKRTVSSVQNFPSPIKSTNSTYPPMPMYTQEFLHLYDHDKGKNNLGLQDNFNTINIAGKLKSWYRDPILLSQDTNGRLHHEVFTEITQSSSLDPTKLPHVSRQTKVKKDVEYDGRFPTWQCLFLESPVQKDEIVGEIKGSVGHFEEYCLDGANRWQELRHPEPFVFFHPQLPIYIDCRTEGTQFRYVRRSCRPNVTMKTFITNDGEYHYCFVAKDDILSGTELTASWYLDQNVFKAGVVKEEHPSEGETDPPWLWVSRLLANFGDCACDGTQPCPFAKLDHRRIPKSLDNKHSNGRKKAKKTKHAASPLANGNTSRAGSEHLKAQDDDEADNRSTSGSARSKPQSRDMTPTNGTVDNLNVMTGLSDREKRKIAMVERNFERLEQDQHVQKKKKRTSGGSTLNTPSLVTSVRSPNLLFPDCTNTFLQKQLGHYNNSLPPTPSASKIEYVDSSTSRHISGSPTLDSPNMHNVLSFSARAISSMADSPPSTYVDSAVQTEPDPSETLDNSVSEMPVPSKNRKFTPLSQKLLRRCYEDRLRNDAAFADPGAQASLGFVPPSPVPSQTTTSTDHTERQVRDIEIKEVDDDNTTHIASLSPSASQSSGLAQEPSSAHAVFQTPPLPSQAAHTSITLRKPSLVPTSSSRFSLNNVPPVPTFSDTTSLPTPTAFMPPASASLAQLPLSLNTSNLPAVSFQGLNAQSPVVAPSPVKKKLSLGDYMSRRSATMTTPTTEKPVVSLTPAPPPPTPIDGLADISTANALPLSMTLLSGDTNGAGVTTTLPDDPHSESLRDSLAPEDSSAVIHTPAPGPEPPPAPIPTHAKIAPTEEDTIMSDGPAINNESYVPARVTASYSPNEPDKSLDPGLR
ncbi:MAG: hypothetical protein Q9160_004327 [Pyrenula sp. 1 TL-2023]